MMNKSLVVLALLLLAVLAMPTASAHVTMYFEPQNISMSGGYGSTADVKIMANITSPHDSLGAQYAIGHNAHVDIVDLQWGPSIFTMLASWNNNGPCPGPDLDWLMYMFLSEQTGVVEICTFTVQCNSTDDYSTSHLNFTCGTDCPMCPIMITPGVGYGEHYPENVTLVGGTVECGTSPSAEPFSKPLYEGWNLISLPLVPAEDNSASAVLSTVDYDAVYRYNATLKQFEDIESTDTMNPGTGYFVHATAACTWEYSGTAYSSMDMSLEQGLNMVGWLNCSKDVGDALSSISGEYYYVARWDTTAGKFEVYNPLAASFNDFTAMDRGTGYFISAKQGCTLSESC
jgi:hypothetical protein